ncbi:signal peptidase I [Patescibacteria group bacterium]|nr:signal peptidase I [Patescibacteria group bacterium]
MTDESIQDIFKKNNKIEVPSEGKPEEPKLETHKEGGELGKTPHKRFAALLIDLGLNLLIVFGLVFVIQSFIASPFRVSGPSMCNTLNYIDEECVQGYGDYVIVNKIGYLIGEPQRGDIVVFRPPHAEDQFYIKRIIGVPGDTVKIINGKVYIYNDEYPTGYELEEQEYLNEDNYGKTQLGNNREDTFEVPDGKYFVLGDNRHNSTDARNCFRDVYEGACRGAEDYFLEKHYIEGKAWLMLWPIQHIGFLADPAYAE